MFAIESAGGVSTGPFSRTAFANAWSWYQYVASPLTFSLRRAFTPERGSLVRTETRWKYCGPVMLSTFSTPSSPSTRAPIATTLLDHMEHSMLPVRPSANSISDFTHRSTPARSVFACAETTSGSAPANVRSWWIV